ncbi:MAG: ferrous iron transporter B, partial [Clostridia bacterium]|nr:ferrous iron transporter B [Clostridia bacterium]
SLLSLLFSYGEKALVKLFSALPIPPFIADTVIYGIYSTTTTVIAVMLPPMAIFFPLFTLLEDFGFLPRVAFNLDNAFKKCGSCGKQALTMCMGLGCNCVGITGSAIIPSKRERLIAILTNSLTPCNGRFGALIAVIVLFFSTGSLTTALCMVGVLAFSTIVSLLTSLLLSKTLLRGESVGFFLEIPPFRRPRIIPIFVRSLFERTFAVLLRAIGLAAPIGCVIFILNRLDLLLPIAAFLEPFAALMGLDGIILLSFILALPANEIVFPIMLMLYTQSAFMTDYSSLVSLKEILTLNGWNGITALCFITFTLFHPPCITSLLTVKKETGSIWWTIAAFILPALIGIFLCIVLNFSLSFFFV